MESPRYSPPAARAARRRAARPASSEPPVDEGALHAEANREAGGGNAKPDQ